MAVGDSSPFDDGTGDPKDTLYDGWDSASNSELIMNSSVWLAAPEPGTGSLLLLGLGWASSRRRRV